MRGGLQGRFKVQDVAEIQRGMMQRQAAHCCPQVQCIAVAVADEAAIDLPVEMNREGLARSTTTGGDRAWAAKLRIMPRGRLEADQVQDLAHRDLPPKFAIVDARHGSYAASALAAGGFLARWARYDLPRIFRRIAPSTMRSRKAIAKGGSPRYSLHASKSMFVARAVER